MKKFMLLYRMAAADFAKMGKGTPEQMEAMMKAWFGWRDKNKSAVLDFGAGFMAARYTKKSGSNDLPPGDGPGGYSIVQAADFAAVEAMVADHPHLMMDGDHFSIEIYEMMTMDG